MSNVKKILELLAERTELTRQRPSDAVQARITAINAEVSKLISGLAAQERTAVMLALLQEEHLHETEWSDLERQIEDLVDQEMHCAQNARYDFSIFRRTQIPSDLEQLGCTPEMTRLLWEYIELQNKLEAFRARLSAPTGVIETAAGYEMYGAAVIHDPAYAEVFHRNEAVVKQLRALGLEP